MGFGQTSGPPASPKQLAYLRSLLKQAGHDDFRTARHEFGLTQRQAGGKFSGGEASALIDRLLGNDTSDAEAGPAPIGSAAARHGTDEHDERADVLRGMPAGLLSAELERRGWTVSPPG